MGFLDSFNVAKAETQCRLCTARIKLQRNKKTLLVKQMRKEVAELLRGGKQEYARIRVEGVIRENLLMHASEILELYLELIAVRTQLIAKTKEIPRDMVEAVSSIIYAAQRVADMPELGQLRALFASKYGKEYAAEASSDVTCSKWQVNANLIRCLLVEPPQPEEKLAMLSEIAQEGGVEWDMDAAARAMGVGVGGGVGGRHGGPAPPIPSPLLHESEPSIPAMGSFAPPAGMGQMDPQAAAAAAAAAAAHAKAMADYAAQLAAAHQAMAGPPGSTSAPNQAPPAEVAVVPPPAGWLLQSAPGAGSMGSGPGHMDSGGFSGAGPSQPAAAAAPGFVNVVDHGFVSRSNEEIQRAYDAAVGPPPKDAKTASTSPASAPLAPPVAPPAPFPAPAASAPAPRDNLSGRDVRGASPLPSVPLDLPRPPQQLPRAPDGTIPGTLNLPHPPTAKIGDDPADEYDELSARLEALKRS